jgi:hypothetical protein
MREQIFAEPLTVPDLSVRITIMLPEPKFRLIENPVVPRDSMIYT